MLPSLDSSVSTPFPHKLLGKWTVVVLEKGTCCYRAGEAFATSAFKEKPTLLQAPSFEKAMELAAADKHILLLPHIHKLTGDVETSHQWESMGDYIFRLNNPPLYLARNSSVTNGHYASIERLRALINPSDHGISDWVNVDSTQEAARACANGDSAFCITNEYGIKYHELEIVTELKKMEICWHPYQHLS